MWGAVIFSGGSREPKSGGWPEQPATTMGMLATIINGMAMMDCLRKNSMFPVRVMSAIEIEQSGRALHFATGDAPFGKKSASSSSSEGPVILTSPTDTHRCPPRQRNWRWGAGAILKATKVDGIYDKDPMKYPDARKFEKLSFMDALKTRLKVMDATAFALCMDNHMPILVFNMNEPGAIKKAVSGETDRNARQLNAAPR